jgi:hypothetical protein
MLFRKGQYINLKDQPESIVDGAEKQYRLFSPLVQLSKPSLGKSWKGSRGILIQKGSEFDHSPLIDLSSIVRALVYGISFVVFTIGNLFKDPGSGGQYNGGQA